MTSGKDSRRRNSMTESNRTSLILAVNRRGLIKEDDPFYLGSFSSRRILC
jgi:hypothetical protein